MTCIAPGPSTGTLCGRPLAPVGPFCPAHAAAPIGRRGGWLSAHGKRTALFENAESAQLDASNIARRLWVGAAPPADRRLERFTLIVLCAREYQPTQVAWQGRVARARLDDADHPPTPAEVHDAVVAARQVATELHAGGQALVTCAKGINRSALVACMAMLMVTPRATPAHAVRLVRKKRSARCLSNPHFVALLERVWSSRR